MGLIHLPQGTVVIFLNNINESLACWVCRFESNWGHGCLSLVSVVCGQVEVPVMGHSLVWRSPVEHGVSDSTVVVVCFHKCLRMCKFLC
jgi:hypothetical protein